MIDHIRFKAPTHNINRVRSLTRITSRDDDNGSVIYRSKKVKGDNRIIKLKGNIVTFAGSFHKAFKQRTTGFLENVTPFNYEDLRSEIVYWEKELDLDLERSNITSVEFGFNV